MYNTDLWEIFLTELMWSQTLVTMERAYFKIKTNKKMIFYI